MLKNFFMLAVRNMGRRTLYTAINIVGLGVASAFCILVYWYVQHERSFDRFHKQVEQLYRVETNDGLVRIQPGYETVVRVGNQSFVEKGNTAFADAGFFQVFDFPLVKGNPATVLTGHNKVVLSETAAKKYFGNEEAIGKTLLLPQQDSLMLTVSGVAKDFPANSSFRFGLLCTNSQRMGGLS
jgi:putative ABC transport system permease protein